jgi:hypothetical protein
MPAPFIFNKASNFGFTAGGFNTKFNGAPGPVMFVEASSDLKTWVPFGTNSADALGVFLIRKAPEHPNGFIGW